MKQFFGKAISVLLTILMIITILPLSGNFVQTNALSIVESGKSENGINWELDSNGKMTLKGSKMIDEDFLISIGFESKKSSIKQIEICEGITGIGAFAFCECNELLSVTVAKSVTLIENCVFSVCPKLNSVTLSEGLNSIGEEAFKDCSALKTIFLPASVRSIISDAFYGCSSLQEVNVASGNKFFSSKDGVLFSLDMKELYLYPVAKTTENYVVPNGTALIWNYAFWLCSNIKTVTIPESVKTIGESAFEYCNNLTSVINMSGVEKIGYWAFSGCTELVSITFPKSLKKIGLYAFSYCEKLEKAELKEGITNIDSNAFYECDKLKTVSLPDTIEAVGESAFENTALYRDAANWTDNVLYINNVLIRGNSNLSGVYTVKTNTKCIAKGAFFDCNKLTAVKIPAKIKIIESSVFSGCDNLTSVEIPDTVTEIAENAFCDCEKLNSISIPKNVVKIGEDAFVDTAIYNNNTNWSNGVLYIGNALIKCSEETVGKYVIKDGTTVIADWAFGYCSLITSIVIPNSVTRISAGMMSDCSSLAAVSIPDNVTAIGDSAFGYCEKLSSVSLPKSLVYIGNYAFENCIGLTSIIFPQGVKEIASDAFYQCEGLTSISLPNSLETLGEWAFERCEKLQKITIPEKIKVLPVGLFNECKKLTEVTIPFGVEEIQESAFLDCESLKTIYYGDEEAEWKKINIEEYGNENLLKANIIYTVFPKEIVVTNSVITNLVNEDIVAVVNGTAVSVLLKNVTSGTVVYKNDGQTEAKATDKLASGMKLVLKKRDKIVDSITVAVPGDINGDTEITSSDARTALRAAVGLEELSSWAKIAANVKKDKTSAISSADARLILRAAVGLENTSEWLKLY